MAEATTLEQSRFYVSTIKEASYGATVTDAAKFLYLEVQSDDVGASQQDVRTDEGFFGSLGRANFFIIDRVRGQITFSVDLHEEIVQTIIAASLGREPSAPALFGGGVQTYEHKLYDWDYVADGLQLPSLTLIVKGGDLDKVYSGCVVREWRITGVPGQSTLQFQATLDHRGDQPTTSDAGITGTLSTSLTTPKFYGSPNATLTITPSGGTARDLVAEKSVENLQITLTNELLDDRAYTFGGSPIVATDPLSGQIRQRHISRRTTLQIELTTTLNSSSTLRSDFDARKTYDFDLIVKGDEIETGLQRQFELRAPMLVFSGEGYTNPTQDGIVQERVVWRAGGYQEVFLGTGVEATFGVLVHDSKSTKYLV